MVNYSTTSVRGFDEASLFKRVVSLHASWPPSIFSDFKLSNLLASDLIDAFKLFKKFPRCSAAIGLLAHSLEGNAANNRF